MEWVISRTATLSGARQQSPFQPLDALLGYFKSKIKIKSKFQRKEIQKGIAKRRQTCCPGEFRMRVDEENKGNVTNMVDDTLMLDDTTRTFEMWEKKLQNEDSEDEGQSLFFTHGVYNVLHVLKCP